MTRRYTTSVLLNAIQKYAPPNSGKGLSIFEIGGANSCFLDSILTNLKCESYDIADTNRYGLSLLHPESRAGSLWLCSSPNI